MKPICPICKSDECIIIQEPVLSIYSEISYELVRCSNCSHLFTLGYENIDELNEIYKSSYNYGAHLAVENEKKWRSEKIIRKIQKIISKDMTIIDIGCMYGFSLEVFRKYGYSNLIGIEIDPLAVKKCREKGFNVFQGIFSEWLKSNQTKLIKVPSCVYLSHVLEHIYHIDSFFQELEEFLSHDSYLVIMVPHSNAWTTKLFKKYWGWWQVPVHIHHFTKFSLLYLLSAYDYKTEEILTSGGDSLFWLSSLASLLGIKSKSQNISLLQKLIIQEP
jgi:SAM-dependent methyltransferase